MIPEDDPVMQHFLAAAGWGPDGPPAEVKLPRLTAKRIQTFNEHVRRGADAAPVLAVSYAALSFDKALEFCPDDEGLLRETGQLLIRVFLSQDKHAGAASALRAAELDGVADDLSRCLVYMKAAESLEVMASGAHQRDCSDRAVELARAWLAAAPQNWQPLVEALSLAALLRRSSRPEEARIAYEEALHLCRLHNAQEEAPSLLTRVLSGLGAVLLDRDRALADGHLEEGENQLRSLMSRNAPAWVAEGLASTLALRATVAERDGDRGLATNRMTEAVGLASGAKSVLEPNYRSRLAVMLAQAGEGSSARDALFELTGFELFCAVGAPETSPVPQVSDVVELARCETEDQGETFVMHSRGETAHGKAPSDKQQADVIRLLDLPPEVVAQRVEGLQRRIARLRAGGPEPKEEERLVRAWQGLLLVQRMARQLLCRRIDLGDQPWGEGFWESPEESANPYYAVHTTADGRERRVLVTVPDIPADAVDPVGTASIAEKVRDLRDVARKPPEDTRGGRPRTIVLWSFAFAGFSQDDVRLLSELQSGALGPRYEIGTPPYGPTSRRMFGVDAETQKAVDDTEAQHTYMAHGLTVREIAPVGAGDQLQRRVGHVLETVMDSLTEGTPALGYCQMPRGVSTWLDYHLGRAAEEPPRCDSFYIAGRKWRDHCGSSRCRTYASRLPKLETALKQRAKDVALRHARRMEKGQHAGEAWDEALSLCDQDPGAALKAYPDVLMDVVFRHAQNRRPRR